MKSCLSQIKVHPKPSCVIEDYFRHLIFEHLKHYPLERLEETQRILSDNTIDIQFLDRNDFVMQICPSSGIIMTSLTTLEIIHALAYAHFLIYDEINKRGIGGVNLDPEKDENVRKAEMLVLWVKNSLESNSQIPPLDGLYQNADNLQFYFKNDKELKFADDLWGLVVSGIIYHEIAHKINNDIDEVQPEMQREREYKADKWMYDWIMNGITFELNENQFLHRTIGITSSLGILAIFDVSNNPSGISTHPNVAERLLAFFNKYIPESDPAKAKEFAYVMAIAAIQTNFIFAKEKERLLKNSYANFREYLDNVSIILKENI